MQTNSHGPCASIIERARTCILLSLRSGRPDIADVAKSLGLQERTFQRRLAREGVTFRGLLEGLRNELSQTLLADPKEDIDVIAMKLGYSGTSCFYRAFRDWAGVTPNEWRAVHRMQVSAGKSHRT